MMMPSPRVIRVVSRLLLVIAAGVVAMIVANHVLRESRAFVARSVEEAVGPALAPHWVKAELRSLTSKVDALAVQASPD
jgi:hypothetical protein